MNITNIEMTIYLLQHVKVLKGMRKECMNLTDGYSTVCSYSRRQNDGVYGDKLHTCTYSYTSKQ